VSRRDLTLRDYLAVLRRRRGLAVAAFAVVFGLVIARALLATPVYRSHVLLQLDAEQSSRGLLEELQAIESASNTAAELEIMRSLRVARGAAERVAPGEYLVEEDAYRPLEVALRRFLPMPEPCRVALETAGLPEGHPAERYVFSFRRWNGALGVDVEREVRGRLEMRTVDGIRSGRAFRAFDRDFTFHVDGDPAGRSYLLVLRPLSAAARWIQERVRAEEVGSRTGVVALAFEAETPALARTVAQALADSYLALKREHRRARVESALRFLEEEKARVRSRLSESEQALDRARTELDAVLLSDRASWIVEKSSALDLERARQRVRLEELRGMLDRLASGVDPADVLPALGEEGVDPRTLEIAGQVARLELQKDGMAESGMRPAHPDRKRVESELESARRRLRAGIRSALSSRVEQAEATLRHLDETLRAYEAEAQKLPATERILAQLGREAEANLEIYRFLVEKDQEAQIALASTLAEVRAIDTAVEPDARARPRLLLEGILAFVLACGAALVAALVAESLDRSVKSPQELERDVGLSLFGAVPEFRTARRSLGARYRGEMVVRDRPDSVLAEAYRALRTNLRFAGIEGEVRSVAVTSAVMGEGKTVTICNLAVACALQGERTILVDMDLRRPDTHRHFGRSREPGLSDWLQGRSSWQEALRPSGVPNLDVVHAGAKVENPAALLDSDRVTALLATLREEYDRVLVDMPPVLAVSDTATVLPRLDGVLLVARARKCDVETLIAAREQVRRVGANLLGVVFNAFDARRMRNGYGYYGYYGYYGRRGDELVSSSQGREGGGNGAGSPRPRSGVQG